MAAATGIPVNRILQGEREKMLAMEERLHGRVVGQDETVHLWPMRYVVAVRVYRMKPSLQVRSYS